MTKTIKCRIALCVDSEGHYAASGFATTIPEGMFGYLDDNLNGTVARYWVEVEVPVPEEVVPVVQGSATKVEGEQ